MHGFKTFEKHKPTLIGQHLSPSTEHVETQTFKWRPRHIPTVDDQQEKKPSEQQLSFENIRIL